MSVSEHVCGLWKACTIHLLQGVLCDGNQTGPQGLRLNAQAPHHIANLHLLKLITPLTLLVHVTADLTDCPVDNQQLLPLVSVTTMLAIAI